jgi:hypothetical protein
MPTVGHDPDGTVTPRRVSARCTSMSCAPGPTVARPRDTRIPWRRERSSTTPSPVVQYPA